MDLRLFNTFTMRQAKEFSQTSSRHSVSHHKNAFSSPLLCSSSYENGHILKCTQDSVTLSLLQSEEIGQVSADNDFKS